MTAADQRPVDPTPVHTEDLPATPTRDRNIPAEAWIEAPASLRASGQDIGRPLIAYKRRLGRWLLWRAGPARGADARYTAIDAKDLSRSYSFRLNPDGSGHGIGPSGTNATRFREWKQDLRAHGDDTALDDTALDDTALDDTALDDTALDDTALDDTEG